METGAYVTDLILRIYAGLASMVTFVIALCFGVSIDKDPKGGDVFVHLAAGAVFLGATIWLALFALGLRTNLFELANTFGLW